MLRLIALASAALTLTACSTPSGSHDDNIRAMLQDGRYARAVRSVEESSKINPKVFPTQNAKPKGEVVVEIDLADCLTLAAKHNRDIMLSQLSLSLADARVQTNEGSFDARINGNVDVERKDQEIENRLTGDTRDREIDTTSSANFGVVVPFRTGSSIGATYAARHRDTNSPFNSFKWSSGLSLSLKQELLQGFGLEVAQADLIIAKTQGEAQALTHRHIAQEIDFGIISTFWQLSLAHEEYRVLQEQHATAKLQLDVAKKRREGGKGKSIDVLRAESAVANAEQQVISAEYTVQKRSDDLLAAIHPDFLYGYKMLPNYKMILQPKLHSLGDLPELKAPPLIASIKSAFAKRGDFLAAQKSVEASGVRVRQRDNALLPNLKAELKAGSWGYGDSADEAGSDVLSAKNRRIGGVLTFDMPIANSADKGRKKEAIAQREKTILELRQIETSIIREVVDATRMITEEHKKLGAIKKARDLAKLEYEAEEAMQKEGRGSSLNVRQAFTTYTRKRLDFARSRVSMELARLSLLKASGDLRMKK